MDAEITKQIKRDFKDPSDEEIKNILEGKDKVNTKKATEGALKALNQFLQYKLEDLDECKLAEVLFYFYPSVKPIHKKDKPYSVQSFKCMRAGLSRYFHTEKGWDIIKGLEYVKANEMFKAMCVDSKKKDCGVRRLYPTITPIDI